MLPPPNSSLRGINLISLAFISNEEVLDIIKYLSDKATGRSSIPLKLLLLISGLIVIPLCHIINTSLSTGNYPDKLKLVKVIPIHKGGSTQDLNNFRPISLLSMFDSIVVQLIYEYVVVYSVKRFLEIYKNSTCKFSIV